MFTNFLLGILGASVLMLLFLLVQPKQDETQGDRLPIVGIAMSFMLAIIAFIGGLAVSS